MLAALPHRPPAGEGQWFVLIVSVIVLIVLSCVVMVRVLVLVVLVIGSVCVCVIGMSVVLCAFMLYSSWCCDC